MSVSSFSAEDFSVFKIDGLDQRMEALKERIQPKLIALGDFFSQELSVMTGEEMFTHVAKHARRKVNPPNDTWVAFSGNKRGYKMVPHFQIGLWETHVFVWFAVIYEAPIKAEFGKTLMEAADKLKETIPSNFVWSIDHTKPAVLPHHDLSVNELESIFQRLQSVKKAEILCGIQIPQEEAVKMTDEKFVERIRDAFVELIPLYKLT
jgi:uncharacterized protein YktB (UPF0637 family)